MAGLMKNSTLVKLVVVDEAHTITHWGEKQDGKDPFRKWFSMIGEIRSLVFCPALIITATAKRSSRTKLKKKLALTSCVEIIQNPDRSNIKLFVSKVKVDQQLEEIFKWIIDLLAEKKKLCPRILIFCASIKMCAELYSAFRMSLDQIDFPHFNMFHSCTSYDIKEKIRQDMEDLNGNTRVLIATSAAGMGVNYQGVHNIVHWAPPKDLDSFVQQLGRAGRDGMQSSEISIYNGRQLCKVDPDMNAYVSNEKLCRREVLLEQYESTPNMENLKKHLCCDICANECECNEESCKTYVHPYYLSKKESDSESSDMDDF